MDSSELEKTGQSAEDMADEGDAAIAIEHQHKNSSLRSNNGVSETKGM